MIQRPTSTIALTGGAAVTGAPTAHEVTDEPYVYPTSATADSADYVALNNTGDAAELGFDPHGLGADPSVVLSAFVAGGGPVPPTFSFEISGDHGATWTTANTGSTGAPDRQYAAVTVAGSSPLRLRFTRTDGTGGLQLIAAYVDATGGEPAPPPGGLRRSQPMLGIWMPAPGHRRGVLNGKDVRDGRRSRHPVTGTGTETSDTWMNPFHTKPAAIRGARAGTIPSMPRRPPRVLAVASTVLLAAVVGLWVRSAFASDMIGRWSLRVEGATVVEECRGVFSGGGTLAFAAGSWRMPLAQQPQPPQPFNRAGWIATAPGWAYREADAFNPLGIYWDSNGGVASDGEDLETCYIQLPFAYLAPLTAALPAWWLLLVAIRWRRERRDAWRASGVQRSPPRRSPQ